MERVPHWSAPQGCDVGVLRLAAVALLERKMVDFYAATHSKTLNSVRHPYGSMVYQKTVRLLRRIKKGVEVTITQPTVFKNFVLDTFSMAFKTEKVYGKPIHVTIEPGNICDQKCPVCETGAGILGRTKGMMTLEVFKKIVDKLHPNVNTILLYFMGEPFLNKDFYDMVKYAKSKGIYVSTSTDANHMDPKRVIECGINEVSFQLGGTTQETHQIYRVNGKLDKALNNIRECMKEKKLQGNTTTRICMGLIVMKHNEHQVEDWFKLGKELGVDDVRTVDPWVRNMEQGKMFLPKDKKYWFYDEQAFEQGVLKPKKIPNNRCNWIYYSLTINWNGDVVPCCRDPTGRHVMGNILTQDLDEIWNGKELQLFRKAIATDQANMEMCKLCSSFRIPYPQPTTVAKDHQL